MKLVTLLIPCYNSTTFAHRLFDSILAQTYSNMEIIAVDDGSTDGTADYIESEYRAKLEAKGCTLKVLVQENAGQSGAINNGLKHVTGDYLVWPDSDDYFCNDKAIEIMERELSAAGERVGMVHSYGTFVDDVHFERTRRAGRAVGENHIVPEFEHCLKREDWWWLPIATMVKMSALDRAIPGREIYVDKRAGQNVQIMLPVIYHYDCLTIAEELVHIVVRRNSHCRSADHYDALLALQDVYERTYIETVKKIEFNAAEQQRYYLDYLESDYSVVKLALDFKYGKMDIFDERCKGINIELLDKYNAKRLKLLKMARYLPFKNYLFRRIRKYVAKMKRRDAEKAL